MNINMQATPTATVSHAAFVACRAARDAIRLGNDPKAAYDNAYAETLAQG